MKKILIALGTLTMGLGGVSSVVACGPGLPIKIVSKLLSSVLKITNLKDLNFVGSALASPLQLLESLKALNPGLITSELQLKNLDLTKFTAEIAPKEGSKVYEGAPVPINFSLLNPVKDMSALFKAELGNVKGAVDDILHGRIIQALKDLVKTNDGSPVNFNELQKPQPGDIKEDFDILHPTRFKFPLRPIENSLVYAGEAMLHFNLIP